MKNRYATPQNIKKKAELWLSTVQPYIPPHRKITFDPHNACLAVIDMQRFFCRETSHAFVPVSTAIIPQVNALIEGFVTAGSPVFATYYAVRKHEAPSMALFWKHPLKEEEPLAALDDRLKLPSNIKLFRKPTYSAFVSTDFGETVLATGCQQIVICGVMTHLCVETAAREFFCRGLLVFIPVDATGTLNEELHLCSLREAAHGFAVPTKTDSLLATLTD